MNFFDDEEGKEKSLFWAADPSIPKHVFDARGVDDPVGPVFELFDPGIVQAGLEWLGHGSEAPRQYRSLDTI